MRIFFALWPDDDTRRRLHRAVCDAVTATGGRAVPAANYHVTLAFLGNVEASRLAAIVAAARLVGAMEHELVLDQFGGSSRAGVLWLEPGSFPTAVLDLYDRLWRQMETLGFIKEQRSFRPHVTLARKIRSRKMHSGADEKSSGTGLTLAAGPVRWRSEGFVLAESVTEPEGARYRVVERFP